MVAFFILNELWSSIYQNQKCIFIALCTQCWPHATIAASCMLHRFHFISLAIVIFMWQPTLNLDKRIIYCIQSSLIFENINILTIWFDWNVCSVLQKLNCDGWTTLKFSSFLLIELHVYNRFDDTFREFYSRSVCFFLSHFVEIAFRASFTKLLPSQMLRSLYRLSKRF